MKKNRDQQTAEPTDAPRGRGAKRQQDDEPQPPAPKGKRAKRGKRAKLARNSK